MTAIIGYLFLIVMGVTVYQVFLSDWIKDKFASMSSKRSSVSNADKIARVKLVSDDAKGIEKFITDNAQYLSDEMVQLLVARIEAIKTDRVIDADNMLKQRIDSLDTNNQQAANTVPEEETVIRGGRRGAKKG